MLVRVGDNGGSGDLAGVEAPPVLMGVVFFALRDGVADFSAGVAEEVAAPPFDGTSSKLSSSGVRTNVTAPIVNRMTITYMMSVFMVERSTAMPNIISGALLAIAMCVCQLIKVVSYLFF